MAVSVESVEGMPAMDGLVDRVTFSDGTLLDTPRGVFAEGQRVRLAAVEASEGEACVDPLPFDPTGSRYVCYGCVYERERGHVYASFGGLLMRSHGSLLGEDRDWFYLRADDDEQAPPPPR